MAKPAYQTEPTALRVRAWSQGHLTGLQLLRIAAWKSAKNLALLTLNSEDSFVRVTAAAMECLAPMYERSALRPDTDSYWDEWGKAAQWAIGSQENRSGLLGLTGVGYPVATAILCILDPTVWPVIDKWSVQTVSGVGRAERAWYGWRGYRAFARHLAEHGPTHWPEAKTIHDLDQCAMRASEPKDPACVPARFPKIGPT